jgi:glutamate synthase (NADPH/NADH) small chain
VRVEWKDGKMVEVAGSEQVLKADLVLLAMGFVSPVAACWSSSACGQRQPRQRQGHDRVHRRLRATNVPKVFAAGDMRRGQSPGGLGHP